MPALETDENSTSDASGPVASIRHSVEHAAHYLPAQGPIEVFVHHNTLHAFEELSFHDAVALGQSRYRAEPYLTEQQYRQLYRNGRITHQDLQTAIRHDLQDRADAKISGLGTPAEIRFAMLRQSVYVGPDAELRWLVAETDALERFRESTTLEKRMRQLAAAQQWVSSFPPSVESDSELGAFYTKYGTATAKWSNAEWDAFALQLLWQTCLDGARSVPAQSSQTIAVRPRDVLLHATGEDIDRHVHDLLIRFCAAFVDQGYSDWLLPNRDLGFFESFVALYSMRMPGIDRWLRHLPAEVAVLRRSGTTAEESILNSLQELGIPEDQRDEFITESLLALGGWAGMIWQLESGVDWVVHAIPSGSLAGMLAVQLILEQHAIRELGATVFRDSKSIKSIIESARNKLSTPSSLHQERIAFQLFQVGQMLGWTPQELKELSESEWQALYHEVESFSGIKRRRMFHEAYERKYRNAALDAFAKHAERRRAVKPPWIARDGNQEGANPAQSNLNRDARLEGMKSARPDFQIVTCIDDREESFRRHLEEVRPTCETFGAAGFFAVAIYYRGAADGFYKPLCPGVITPNHYVQEDVGYTFEGVHQSRAQMRRRIGKVSHLFHTRSRTFLGGIVTGIIGSLATAPLVARVLFPHLTARIRRRFGSLLQPPPVTKLQLERYADRPGPDNGQVGYSIDEMAGVVVRLLQDIGLTKSKDFSRLFIVCGHGSSSLNNPHESAYCCGACAGKRGGPNARAFAQMANDWRVRAQVQEQGIQIPDDTFFVGAYHNTCDDSVVFFDLDRLPASHREDFDSAHEAIEQARKRNAHERCRRFVSAPLNISEKDALRHVEARAQDISQARPEYNHATNALCLVGRRDWSRGLFLDRRAFLTSYDPTQDDAEHNILFRILSAAIPVCAGINLEYYFSCVDYTTYGSGSKLPHNLVSLLGVMEGTASDLRTGLYQQMVEIHEPLRLTFVIETTAEAMLSIMERNAAIGRLVRGGWVHLAVIDSTTSEIKIFEVNGFQPYHPSDSEIPVMKSSLACYTGSRDHLPFFSIREAEVTQ